MVIKQFLRPKVQNNFENFWATILVMLVIMDRSYCFSYFQWLQPKDTNRNLLSAFFHMITITLISTSLVQLSWFQIIGGFCIPHLSVYTFFTYGYTDNVKTKFSIYHNEELDGLQLNTDYEVIDESAYRCITPKIVNIMRIIILFCFMAIIFSLIGFFLDIVGPKSKAYDFVRKNALPGACTFLWILAIVTLCCYVQSLIEESLKDVYPDFEVEVNYEYGFFAITAAGVTSMAGTTSNLLCTYIPRSRDTMEQNLLSGGWEDVETFSLPPPPPPPYSAPPPPYTP